MTMKMKSKMMRRFWDDRRGNVALMFGLALVPMVAAAGVAFDYSSASSTRVRVQAAADSAVLAAARLNDLDDNRPGIAKAYFEGQLTATELAMVQTSTFAITEDKSKIAADISFTLPMKFGAMTGMSSAVVAVKAAAAIARPDVRQLDIVMCIDATGSMWGTINAVKTNALNLESNLNTELEKRGIKAFDAMRVRAIYYRDYGGSDRTGAPAWTWDGTKWVIMTTAHPDYWKGVGDIPPMKFSSFFDLPNQRTSFQGYVNPEGASGGGDWPESGLECVNEAMDSAWAKVGDIPSGGSKPLDGVYPLIAVWTDAPAHRPNYTVSLKNPDYPPATKMPRTYGALRGKWDNPTVIDQSRKMLVFFGNPNLSGSSVGGVADGWPKIKNWPGFLVGGTLTEGNSQLVSKLADAIASKISKPQLTQ